MITVFVGHSGARLSADPSTINNLDGLKALISEYGIQPRNQILLTAQGKQVRTQTLLTEQELFVFDSSRLNSKNVTSSSSSSLTSSAASEFDPGPAPEAINNLSDLSAWQTLFRTRLSWAKDLMEGSETKARQAEKWQDEQLVIERSLGVAMVSLQQHAKSAEQKLFGIEPWAQEVLQEQGTRLASWEGELNNLRRVPARSEFSRFIQPGSAASSKRSSQQESAASLQGFVDIASVKRAASAIDELLSDFEERFEKMRKDLATVTRDGNELIRAVEHIGNGSETSNISEPGQLLEEIEMVVNKISSDLEHVRTLPPSAQSISQASKMALLHTRNYLPNLAQYCGEINDITRKAQTQRYNSATRAMEHMRTLSSIESVLAELYQDIKALDVPESSQAAFATLSVVSRLPSVYGALLIESVRRREWIAKMKRDAGTLQEEVATYQDEEDKRRKKWIRTVEDVAKPEALHSSVLGIELSLQNEGGSWPMVTRDELNTYLTNLNDVYGQSAITEEMEQSIKDLDKPTRKQTKHAKAFKNGSIHEAAFGDTSLLLRGDDQHKGLRDINARLEEDLKGQKSRVRKLEDLLHRQTTIGRANTGDMFTPQSASSFDRNLISPGGMPRPPSDDFASTSHQRKPSVQFMEEKKLARRVVDLEAELHAAREEVTSRKSSDAEFQKQVEEAVLTKKDLMENMDAQQREFATERRNLERELAEAKERAEELENELERLVGSRDDERSGADGKIATLQNEIVQLKDDSAGHAARAATEQDARTTVERKLVAAEADKDEAESETQRTRLELENDRELNAEHAQLLSSAYAQFAPDAELPTGVAALAVALEDLARRTAAHTKDLEEAVAFAKSENKSLWTSNERQKSELAASFEKQVRAEEQIRQRQERLASEEAKTQALAQQLKDEREQLRNLRDKFADGETGSEVLRKRVADEEVRAATLAGNLAEANSHINSLDVELMRLQRKHDTNLDVAQQSSEWLDKRGKHANDVSQKLFAQNSRLMRLLERLGLLVSYQDDTMVIERASRMASSTSMMDPGSQLIRTTSLASPPPTRKSSAADESADLSIIRWAEAQSMTAETAQFERFVQHISRFDIDAVTEAIVKRLRDFEYTARKYNKEAKDSVKRAEAYKDRSLKLRTEAQAKIAVKDFKEGDLALFLPTRGQAKGAWAAFNVGCPHYFLSEMDGMRLSNRDYIVARIHNIEQKVVNLSKTSPAQQQRRQSIGELSDASNIFDDDNPFDLSDGLTWWMVHATEERGAGGAPTTPGLGKTTVAAATVDAKAMRVQRYSSDNASKSLNKTLDSRRSSSASTRKGFLGATNTDAVAVGSPVSQHRPDSSSSMKPLQVAAVSTGAGMGLGIAEEDDTQPQNEQVRSLANNSRSGSRTASPSKASQRSKSPSKSVRSLQKHLEVQSSPAKSPAKAPAKTSKQGWESLWQGGFSLESPSKSSNK